MKGKERLKHMQEEEKGERKAKEEREESKQG